MFCFNWKVNLIYIYSTTYKSVFPLKKIAPLTEKRGRAETRGKPYAHFQSINLYVFGTFGNQEGKVSERLPVLSIRIFDRASSKRSL